MDGRIVPESRFPFLRADPDSPKHMPPEPQVTKTASGESKRNICPLARWGMEHLSAYKGGFATRTSDLKRSAGKVLRAAPLRHPMRPSHFKSKRTFNLSSRSPVHIGVLFPAFNRGAKAHDTSVYEVRGISTCARVLEKSRLCEFAAQVYVSIGSCVNSSWCRCGNRVGTGTAKRAPALPAGAGPKVKSTPAPSISYTCANDTFHLRD